MEDYGAIYADYLASVVQSMMSVQSTEHLRRASGQRIGDGIVAKGVMAGDRPAASLLDSGGTPPGADGHLADPSIDKNETIGAHMPPSGGAVALPSGFRRLSDLRKRAPKKSYDDLKGWVGKTIRLDGVGFQTGEKDGKTSIVSGTMTFSEFDPSDPDRETDQTVTTSIPRGALRALYEGLTKNPDETIVCDVVQSKRGLALQ